MIELSVAFALLEGGIWSDGRVQLAWAVALAGWLAFCAMRSRRSARDLGLTGDGFRSLAWLIPAAICLGAVIDAGAYFGGSVHALHGARTPFWHTLLYVVWAFVQQYIAQSFMFVRLEAVFGGRRAVWITAALFSLAHIPNGILIAATFAMGLAWSELFRRYRNIYPLAIAHGILGLALAVALPEAVTHHMRVGIAYWK